ncbi:hypothetical protein [Bradyrhizobium huanghuaihaiense]
MRDVVPVDPDQMPAAPTERYRLHYRGLTAEGFYAGKKTFYIQPGADFAVGEKRGMTAHNKARRKGLVKFLEPVSGADNRMRVRVGLRCLSAPIAAKILTGEHIGTRVWQPDCVRFCPSPATLVSATSGCRLRASNGDLPAASVPNQKCAILTVRCNCRSARWKQGCRRLT